MMNTNLTKTESSKRLEIEILKIPESDREIVLDWATQIKMIQDQTTLSKKEKLKELKELNNSKAFKSAFKIVTQIFSTKWKNANLPTRLSLVGGGVGILFAGAQGAGIAALGSAIGLPLFLVTAAGGAFIGTIIDNLKK
ncbi:hypothetical protein PQ459_07850 [Chryseobacterium sp. KACC 21268]|nr:hypothetical protein PQ459_07850 [Chryseobacterium sp. KACC 21268]